MTLRASVILTIAFAALAMTGCVERRFVITTEPYGAMVYDWTDVPIGATPADKPFTYPGKYRFKIVKDGYQTKIVEEKVKAPWYSWPLIDFVSENMLPWTVRDIRRLHYQLEPVDPMSYERVRDEGAMLRQRGQTIGVPLPETPRPTIPTPPSPPNPVPNVPQNPTPTVPNPPPGSSIPPASVVPPAGGVPPPPPFQ